MKFAQNLQKTKVTKHLALLPVEISTLSGMLQMIPPLLYVFYQMLMKTIPSSGVSVK